MAENLCFPNIMNILTANITNLLNSALPEKAEENVKIYWPNRKGTRELGCIVNLSKAVNRQDVQSVLHEISVSILERSKCWAVPVVHCAVIGNHSLLVSVDAVLMTRKILSNIAMAGFNYGKTSEKLPPTLKNSVLIHATHMDVPNIDLTFARTIFIMKFVQRLLEFFSDATVICTCETDKGGHAFSSCDEQCEPDIVQRREMMMSLAQKVSSSLKSPSAGDGDGRGTAINLWQYVADNPSSFHSALNLLPVPTRFFDDSGGTSDILCHASRMEHIAKRHISVMNINSCLLVSSHACSYRSFVSSAVWHCLSEDYQCAESKPSISHYVHGPVTCETGSDQEIVLAEHLYRVKFGELRNCFTHKYGQPDDVTAGNRLDDMFTELTDFCIKFEMLRCKTLSPVTLQCRGESHPKSGAFIMYSYARIASLLRKYDAQVGQGVYPPLPDIQDVDLSTLTRQEERNLVALCGQYPEILQEVFNQVAVSLCCSAAPPALHKILRYLTDLSQDLSIFYSRVHVLVEAVPQTYPKMFARLWLVKSVKQVFENIFALLDVVPIPQL